MKISLLSMLMVFAFACKKDKASAVVGDAVESVESATNTKGTSYAVIPEKSMVNWAGSKLTGTHTGTLKVSEGKVLMNNGKLTGGKFTIDMSSLTCTDLAAGDGKEKLEGHLKSGDFFDVANHPDANFEITKVTGLEGDAKANSLVYGNLTIKGVSKQVGFKANVSSNGNSVSVSSPDFKINRTDFGIKYGSTSLADTVKDKAIDDQVTLSVVLGATKG